MSQTPKPDSKDSGQVVSLTKHRAAMSDKAGAISAVYDTSYQKGERILCDDPGLAYVVRAGRVRVQKEMQARGGRKLVTIDFLDKGHPLLDSRFIPNAKDDSELHFYADTDVTIGGYPIESFAKMFDVHEYLVNYSQTASRRLNGLREAFFKQLLRYQEKLEENDALKGKIDELADENLGQQMTIGELQQTAAEAEKTLAAAKSDAESAKRETKAVREREKSAIAKAREAFEYFQSLEQRSREESQQFPVLIKKVLAYFGIAELSTHDLMFVITEAAAGKVAATSEPQGSRSDNSGLFTLEELSAISRLPPPLRRQPQTPIIIDADEPCEDVGDDELLPLDALPPSRPKMATMDFGVIDIPSVEQCSGPSGYCLLGGDIPRDDATADEDSSHTPTMPPPDALLDQIEDLQSPGPRNAGPGSITTTQPMFRAMSIGQLRGMAPRPSPAKVPAPTVQPPVTMATPRSYPRRQEGSVESLPLVKQPEPFDEEAPTSKGMPPISCPVGMPFADDDEVLSSETKEIDVRSFRPKK
ncbi:MAG: hypothetical protein WC551_07035 [Patescibacteria group bacterium]